MNPPQDLPAREPASEQFARFRRTGDPAALTAVFDGVAPELLKLAGHLAHEGFEAEDLVQETFLIAIRKARRWDPRRPVLPWLVGILSREARRLNRKRGRAIDVERLVLPGVGGGERAALDAEVRGEVESAVRQLPACYEEVVRSALLDGEAPSGIAARLGRAPGTVRVQLHRGLDLLRGMLPAGLSLSAAAVLAPRGLGAVRATVRDAAQRKGPGLAAQGWPSSLGITAMGTKAIVLTGTLVAVLLGAFLWVDSAPEPLVEAGSVVAAQPLRQPQAARLEPLAEPRRSNAAVNSAGSPAAAPAGEPEPPVLENAPGACRVTGRLVSPMGAEIGEPWVCFWTTQTGQADRLRSVPRATVDAGGRFEITLEPGLSGDVIYAASRHRVSHASIVVPDQGSYDLGDLALDPGASISGTAWQDGERVGEGTRVLAQAPFEDTELALAIQRIQRRGKGYMHSNTLAFADADGAFVVEGLDPGIQYSLEALAAPSGGPEAATMIAASAGQKVPAPASGIRLDSGLVRMTLRVTVDGAGLAKSQVMQQLGPEDPRRVLGVAADNVGGPYLTNDSGELELQVAAGYPLFLEVRGPSCEVRQVALGPEQIVAGARVEVQLERETATADLAVELVGPAPSAIDGSSAVLFVHGPAYKRYSIGPVDVQGGVALFEGLACDLLGASLFLTPRQDALLVDLPFERFSGSRIGLGNLQPGERREVRLEAALGGRVQLELAGMAEGKHPTFELVEANGNPVRPVIYAESANGGYTFAMQLDGPGPYTLGLSLPPGTYTLRQTSQAYAPGDRKIELRAGEVTPVTFLLDG